MKHTYSILAHFVAENGTENVFKDKIKSRSEVEARVVLNQKVNKIKTDKPGLRLLKREVGLVAVSKRLKVKL